MYAFVFDGAGRKFSYNFLTAPHAKLAWRGFFDQFFVGMTRQVHSLLIILYLFSINLIK